MYLEDVCEHCSWNGFVSYVFNHVFDLFLLNILLNYIPIHCKRYGFRFSYSKWFSAIICLFLNINCASFHYSSSGKNV